MSQIKYKNKICNARNNETVLEALLRNGFNVPFSCKAGVCHTCTMQLL